MIIILILHQQEVLETVHSTDIIVDFIVDIDEPQGLPAFENALFFARILTGTRYATRQLACGEFANCGLQFHVKTYPMLA